MILKYTKFILQLLLFLSFNIFSQWKYPKAKKLTKDVVITYKIKYDKPLSENQKLSTRFKKKIIVSFNNNQLIEKTFTTKIGNESIVFIDYNARKTYSTYKYSTKKILISEDLKVGATKTTLLKGLEQNVAGVICDIYSRPSSKKNVYTTKKFGIRYSKHFSADGFLLQYGGDDKYLGGYTVIAEKIEYKKLPAEVFNLDEYSIKTEEELKDFNSGRRTQKEDVKVVAARKIGSKMPNFNLRTVKGKNINNKNLSNKVVVLNFWYTTCIPCKKQISQLNKLKAKFKGKNVEFIAITLDDKTRITRFLQRYAFRYDMVEKGKWLASEFGIQKYPTNLIIDKKGVIQYYKTDANIFADMSAKITKELSKK